MKIDVDDLYLSNRDNLDRLAVFMGLDPKGYSKWTLACRIVRTLKRRATSQPPRSSSSEK